MGEQKFNLLDEPWIQVMKKDGKVETRSILEVLFHAQEYVKLAGETEAQNAPILRLLEAILLAAFYQYNVEGEKDEIDEAQMALDRWTEIWSEGRFPEEPIRKYIEPYRNRFWLIDEENPFMQTKAAQRGTEYKTSKLIGELSESSNKVRLFQNRTKDGKTKIPFAEAARWLLFVNAYDDVSGKSSGFLKEQSKKTGIKIESPGAGWLGRIAQVYARGENLFQTLMYNLVLLKDKGEIWNQITPAWEKERRDGERVQIAPPDDPGALFTISSRRLLLKTEKDMVTGYYSMGGDFFKTAEMRGYFTEMNSLYRHLKATRTKQPSFPLRRHDPTRQIWRDFSNIMICSDENQTPGIVGWMQILEDSQALKRDTKIYFDTCSVQYGDKDFFITDMTGDSLTLNVALLNSKFKSYRIGVEKMVETCDKLADASGYCSRNIAISKGNTGEAQLKKAYQDGKTRMYTLIDPIFRQWIASLDPNKNNFEQEQQELIKALWRLTYHMAEKFEEGCTPDALEGRYYTESKNDKDGKKDKHYSIPESINIYLAQANKILGSIKKDSKEDTKKDGEKI